MAKAAKITIPDDLVVFEDSEGNLISNDPRFHALQQLGVDMSQGVSFDQSQPAEAEERTAKVANSTPQPKTAPAVTSPHTDDDGNRTYKELEGKDLVAFAKERGVETKGLKAREVRQLLIDQDNESEEDEEEDDDETEDEESDEDDE